MARALIVGCGCRGRLLGGRLRDEGWTVRGTSRSEAGRRAIEEAGIEAAMADPDRPATLLDLVGDVAVVYWLFGSAAGDPEGLDAIHGPRLERFLEMLVDTPVRGFVYEAVGSVDRVVLEAGAEAVQRASATWRIRTEIAAADPTDPPTWAKAMLAAATRLTHPPTGRFPLV
jgi:nucleoside-diphosphate-sugar epimerase